MILLDLQGNKLADEAVTDQSLKGLSGLVQVNLARNNLKTMPPGLPATTIQLFLDSNDIDKIPPEYFKSLPKMAFLRLNFNKLDNGGLPKNIFNLSSILDLQLSHNQLTEIPLFPLGLEHLHLDHNKIKSKCNKRSVMLVNTVTCLIQFFILFCILVQLSDLPLTLNIVTPGVNGTEICPVPIGTIDEGGNKDRPRLSYLRLDGNEIKPPISWDVMVCFRQLRAIVI